MASSPDSQPVQSPRAWRELTRTLGYHVPARMGEVRRAGKRIRALGGKRPTRTKGR